MGSGVIYSTILLPTFCKLASMRSQLEDQELSIAVTKLFKSLSATIPPMAYLAAASMRCILAADDESPLYQQCGNPIFSSYMVKCLLIMGWLMTYVVGPLMKETKTKTWMDIMVLRMGKIERLEFSLLGLMGSFAWVLYATTNEDGESMNFFMYLLVGLFLYFLFSLLGVIIYDIFIKPILFHSSATTYDDSAVAYADADDANSSFSSTTTISLSNADASDAFELSKLHGGLSGMA